MIIIFTFNAYSSEKIIKFEVHINKLILSANKNYRLELRERAAIYHADEKYLACLQDSLKNDKLVILEVEAYSLNVKNCVLK
jgi:translation initiation factor IF-2